MANRLAVIRADASPSIGGGHILRCLTLADTLSSRGWRCAFLIGPSTAQTVPDLRNSIHELIDANDLEPARVGNSLGRSCDLLVVDHYGLDEVFEKQCRPWALRIAVIDDLANRSHDADFLLDQTAGRKKADYSRLVPKRCLILAGAPYALLRPQFHLLRPTSLARRNSMLPFRKLLISCGLTDPTDLTSFVLEALASCGFADLEVTVILGSGAKFLPRVQELVKIMPFKAELAVNCNEMAQRMSVADLAIGAAGSSSFERCCLGLPSILIVTANNQAQIAAELDRIGAAVNLGPAESVRLSDLQAKLHGLHENPSAMVDASRAAARACDGLGAGRVADALQTIM
jgi:UDP-2,4-diacetamido-2,4,6-trideoxy-beta-L-altropyranose hydrolase